MKVYVVTDGDYSDYCIKAIFSEKRKAELYCAVKKCDNVEEWEVDECNILTNTIPKKVFMAKVYKENERWQDSGEEYSLKYCEEFIEKEDCVLISITVDTDTSQEKAMKIMKDKYARWKYNRMCEER